MTFFDSSITNEMRLKNVASQADVKGSEDVPAETTSYDIKDEALNEFYSSIGRDDKDELADPINDNADGVNAETAEGETSLPETQDPTMNSNYQLNRLLRPGSSYINLNPFAVLDVKFEDAIELIKRKYRKLSVLVHPDKNPNDKDRAEKAFEALNRAYKMLVDEKQRRKCLEVIEEAKDQVKKRRDDEQRRLMDKGRTVTVTKTGAELEAEESEVWNTAIKLFADLERIRIREESRKAEERLRNAEDKTIHEELLEARKEFNKNYEESRDSRVFNWKEFQKQSKNKRKAMDALNFRPPKAKQEKRSPNKEI